jgi:hypothetical protein
MNAGLASLADILADWLEPAPNIPVVYLFGSRVRGDHRPDSDVDVRVLINEWRNLDRRDMDWWGKENDTDFAALKGQLPGPLSLHREQSDDADAAIMQGRKTPVMVYRRIVCVWTPPKANLSQNGPPRV